MFLYIFLLDHYEPRAISWSSAFAKATEIF